MSATHPHTSDTATSRPRWAAAIGGLAAVSSITFFLGAVLHLGIEVPLGFGVLQEPRILPATIVESLCGLALAVSGYAVLTRQPWAWPAAVSGYAFALAGVVLGIVATTIGPGPNTALNSAYHATMAVVLTAGLLLLATQAVQKGLGRGAGRRTRRDRADRRLVDLTREEGRIRT